MWGHLDLLVNPGTKEPNPLQLSGRRRRLFLLPLPQVDGQTDVFYRELFHLQELSAFFLPSSSFYSRCICQRRRRLTADLPQSRSCTSSTLSPSSSSSTTPPPPPPPPPPTPHRNLKDFHRLGENFAAYLFSFFLFAKQICFWMLRISSLLFCLQPPLVWSP